MTNSAIFREYEAGRDEESLVALLTSESWPLRVTTDFTPADVLKSIENGEYGAGNDLTFFIEDEGRDVGLVRLEDVVDQGIDPTLDIRIRERWRRRGLGAAAVRYVAQIP